MSTSLTSDVLFAMRAAEERTGLSGPEKRKLALDMLVASGLIQESDRSMAGAVIDAVVWAAKNRNDIKAFAKRGFKFCC